jgi:hypothetical protein
MWIQSQKKLIEQAYQLGEKLGLAIWTQDEAGPYQTKPYAGQSWQEEGHPFQQPHEYIRDGVAKIMTLFHPANGEVRVKGVTSCTNAVLHPWLQEQFTQILATLPEKQTLGTEANRYLWQTWQTGLSAPIVLPENLPPLRMLLIWDNLRGHHTPIFVSWLIEHGIMPLYTPIGGSWLNMAESMQRILVRRALSGQYPETPEKIISLLEGVAQGWNLNPTPFEWGGKRAARRQRSCLRRHALGGSGACTRHPLRRQPSIFQKWNDSHQTTH